MRTTSKQLAASKANGGKFIPRESNVRLQVVKWLKLQYPGVLFKISYGDDALLTPRQAKAQKELSCARGWPDLFIAEPRGVFKGMFLEIKKDDVNIYNAKGLFSNEHISEQAAMMDKLAKRGYYCKFAKGFAGCQSAINHYLGL